MAELKYLPKDTEKGSSNTSGYTMKFTERGLGYLARDDGGQDDDYEAAGEHVQEKLPFNMSLAEIQRRYGIGTRMYFTFLKFIILCNAIMCLLSMIHWGAFQASSESERFVYDGYPNMNPTSVQRRLVFFESLFVCSYPENRRGFWLGMNILAVLCWFSFGPVFLLIARRVCKQTNVAEHDNPFAFSGMEEDKIPGNDHFTARTRITRLVISYTIFCSLIVISGSVIYGLQKAILNYGDITDVFNPMTFLVTLTVSLLNFFWKFVGGKLTKFEIHKTWAAFRKHHVMKLYLFKVINVTVLYASVRFAFASEGSCPLQDTGTKFLTLIITDLFVFNGIELVMPQIKRYLARHTKRFRSTGGDESEKPDFDVAEELLELFYRMFVMYLGMLVFPPISILTLITNCIEYPLDKYRMLRVCQKPKRLDLSMKYFLTMFMIITAFLALISYPNGAIFILSGEPTSALSKCSLFGAPQ